MQSTQKNAWAVFANSFEDELTADQTWKATEPSGTFKFPSHVVRSVVSPTIGNQFQKQAEPQPVPSPARLSTAVGHVIKTF